MKPAANGKPVIKAAVGKELVGERKPLGNPPADFDADEKRAWKTIADELPWVDKSHRMWVARAAKIKARLEEIDGYFKTRKAEFKKNKLPVADARLGDNGRRHPHMVELHANEDTLCRMLTALGASPAAQVRMMSNITKSQKPPGSDTEGSPSDSGRFFK